MIDASAPDDEAPADRALARRLAQLMRWGVLIASVLLVVGVVLTGADAPRAAAALISAGCAALILLPVLRLVFMLASFARRGDRLYVAISLLVIVLIVSSAVAGSLSRP